MNYIKSAGFFSIFYVILYFGLSIGLRFFITDSDLFTGLFYVILLAANSTLEGGFAKTKFTFDRSRSCFIIKWKTSIIAFNRFHD